jgi:hypothetical protein
LLPSSFDIQPYLWTTNARDRDRHKRRAARRTERDLRAPPAREPDKERTEREPGLRCKGDIGGQADDDAERQAQHGSKPDGGYDTHRRISLAPGSPRPPAMLDEARRWRPAPPCAGSRCSPPARFELALQGACPSSAPRLMVGTCPSSAPRPDVHDPLIRSQALARSRRRASTHSVVGFAHGPSASRVTVSTQTHGPTYFGPVAYSVPTTTSTTTAKASTNHLTVMHGLSLGPCPKQGPGGKLARPATARTAI